MNVIVVISQVKSSSSQKCGKERQNRGWRILLNSITYCFSTNSNIKHHKRPHPSPVLPILKPTNVDTTARGKFLQRRQRRFRTSSSSPPHALHTGSLWWYRIIFAHSRARGRRLLFFGRDVLQTHDSIPIFPWIPTHSNSVVSWTQSHATSHHPP